MGEGEGILEAHAEMKRLRRNGGEGFGDIFGVTLRLAKKEGNRLERESEKRTCIREDVLEVG